MRDRASDDEIYQASKREERKMSGDKLCGILSPRNATPLDAHAMSAPPQASSRQLLCGGGHEFFPSSRLDSTLGNQAICTGMLGRDSSPTTFGGMDTKTGAV